MRKGILKGLTAASLLAGLSMFSAPAQAADVRFRVPFDFTVQDTTLRAGDYVVSTRDAQLLVRGNAGGVIVLSNRHEPRGSRTPQLVFHKYGETLILRQVSLGGGIVRELARPRTERELIRTAARSGQTAQNVETVVVPGS